VLIGGMIHDLGVRQHKGGRHKGEPWAAFQVQDGHGSVKCQFFAPGYRDHAHLIKDDAIVFIRGSVDDPAKDEGNFGIRVRVSEVITGEQIRERHTRSVTLRLKTGQADEELLTQVQKVLLANQGRCDVYLEFENASAERALVRVSSRYFVSPTARFEHEMTQLLGEGALAFAR
jgi:DNA polymerase III alpha subunit